MRERQRPRATMMAKALWVVSLLVVLSMLIMTIAPAFVPTG